MIKYALILIGLIPACGWKTAPLSKTADLRPELPYKLTPAKPPIKPMDHNSHKEKPHD